MVALNPGAYDGSRAFSKSICSANTAPGEVVGRHWCIGDTAGVTREVEAAHALQQEQIQELAIEVKPT